MLSLSAAEGSAATRLPGIEGLRALAACAIAVYHCWLYDGGELLGATSRAATLMWNLSLGVTLFFALSGFLLYRPFAAAIAQRRSPPRRALPVQPSAADPAGILGDPARQRAGPRDDAHARRRGAARYRRARSPAPARNGTARPELRPGHARDWHRSGVVPGGGARVLPRAAAARARGRAVPPRPRGAATADRGAVRSAARAAARRPVGQVRREQPVRRYGRRLAEQLVFRRQRSFFAQADLFSFGMLAAVARAEVVDGGLVLPPRWRGGALVLALGILASCAATLDRGQPSYLPQNMAAALAGALLVAVVCFPAGSGRVPLAQRLFQSPPLVAVGIVSYSVFLWHERMICWLTAQGERRLHRLRLEPRPVGACRRRAVAAHLSPRRAPRAAPQPCAYSGRSSDGRGAARGGTITGCVHSAESGGPCGSSGSLPRGLPCRGRCAAGAHRRHRFGGDRSAARAPLRPMSREACE